MRRSFPKPNLASCSVTTEPVPETPITAAVSLERETVISEVKAIPGCCPDISHGQKQMLFPGTFTIAMSSTDESGW
ncbi:hypothetical protein D3C73_1276770 [compost metagenome]